VECRRQSRLSRPDRSADQAASLPHRTGEIEAALLDHPSFAQAVVVFHKDDPANPRPIA
jgi:acyl-coenzyme A synthetase/AMP-(fatty) acid ligase